MACGVGAMKTYTITDSEAALLLAMLKELSSMNTKDRTGAKELLRKLERQTKGQK